MKRSNVKEEQDESLYDQSGTTSTCLSSDVSMDRTPGAAASPLLRETAFLAVSFALGPPLIEEIARITRFSSAEHYWDR